jgi:hypothetical protein
MNKTHGEAKHSQRSPEYLIWQSMVGRCNSSTHSAFKDYGAKGITVCDRWRGKDGFQNFLADMGRRPTPKYTIDRFPNGGGNYEPDNCRWATRTEQNNNRRSSRLLTFLGRTQTTTQWAKEFGLKRDALYWRLNAGWSVGDALQTPITQRKQSCSSG